MTSIPRDERLIVALDVATPQEARRLAERIGDAARFYKVRIGNSFAPVPREASGSGTGRVGEAVRVGHNGLGLPLRDRQASGLMANKGCSNASH